MSWTTRWLRPDTENAEALRRFVEQQAKLLEVQTKLSERLDALAAQADERAARLEARIATLEGLTGDRRNVDLVERDGLFFYVYERDLAHDLAPPEQRQRHVALGPAALVDAVQQAARSSVNRDLDQHDPVARAVSVMAHAGPVNLIYVGINYGFHLLSLTDCIRKNGIAARVVGFDPGRAGELVSASIRLNGMSDAVEFHRLALSNVNGSAVIEEVAGHSEDNKLVNMSASPLRSSRLVETRRFDDFAAEHGLSGPSVLVVDTQGAEPEIIEGAAGYLDRNPCVLVSEFTPWALGSRMLAQDFLRRLLAFGRVFDLGTLANLGVTAGRPVLIGEEVTEATADAYAARVFRDPPGWSDVMVMPRAEPAASRLLAAFDIR